MDGWYTPRMESRPANLIVVEDSTLVRRMLMHLLSREPDFHIVAEAENGRQGVELTLERRPDVVLTDVEMPVMDGIQAARQISALAPRTRVILLTGHAFLASACEMVGSLTCVEKSCTPTELIDTIRKALAQPHPASTTRRCGSNLQSATELLSKMAGLTARERTILQKLVEADKTSLQLAHELTREWHYPVTEAAVKHTIERVMNKMEMEPRTRTALIKHVMEYAHQFL